MRILLALSGGIDSMYLANRAFEMEGPFALFPGPHEFAAAHCNFSLRGDDSDGDEEFVRSWCESKGIKCFVKRFDTLGYAASKGISTEMAARELRYGWFADLVDSQGFDALAVAHNANDNAETLMLNLLRGTGSRGLRGMAEQTTCNPGPGGDGGAVCGALSKISTAPQTAPSVPHKGMKIIRPLLTIERKEIEKWMRENGKEWREDRTNAESIYKRNILRNEVFPILSRVNPSFIRTIGEDIERFKLVDDIAEDYFREKLALIQTGSSFGVDSILALTHWKYILWRILEETGISYPTFGKLTALLDRYRREPRGTVTICGKAFETPVTVISIKRIPKSGPVIEISKK